MLELIKLQWPIFYEIGLSEHKKTEENLAVLDCTWDISRKKEKM